MPPNNRQPYATPWYNMDQLARAIKDGRYTQGRRMFVGGPLKGTVIRRNPFTPDLPGYPSWQEDTRQPLPPFDDGSMDSRYYDPPSPTPAPAAPARTRAPRLQPNYDPRMPEGDSSELTAEEQEAIQLQNSEAQRRAAAGDYYPASAFPDDEYMPAPSMDNFRRADMMLGEANAPYTTSTPTPPSTALPQPAPTPTPTPSAITPVTPEELRNQITAIRERRKQAAQPPTATPTPKTVPTKPQEVTWDTPQTGKTWNSWVKEDIAARQPSHTAWEDLPEAQRNALINAKRLWGAKNNAAAWFQPEKYAKADYELEQIELEKRETAAKNFDALADRFEKEGDMAAAHDMRAAAAAVRAGTKGVSLRNTTREGGGLTAGDQMRLVQFAQTSGLTNAKAWQKQQYNAIETAAAKKFPKDDQIFDRQKWVADRKAEADAQFGDQQDYFTNRAYTLGRLGAAGLTGPEIFGMLGTLSVGENTRQVAKEKRHTGRVPNPKTVQTKIPPWINLDDPNTFPSPPPAAAPQQVSQAVQDIPIADNEPTALGEPTVGQVVPSTASPLDTLQRQAQKLGLALPPQDIITSNPTFWAKGQTGRFEITGDGLGDWLISNNRGITEYNVDEILRHPIVQRYVRLVETIANQ